jgi:hypothetical protein
LVVGRPGHGLVDRLAPQQVGLTLVQYLEPGIDPHLGWMSAQDLGTQTVNGANAGRIQLAV